MNYKIEKEKIFISLDPGDKINENLEKVAVLESIQSAWMSGIGAISDIEIGYFDPAKKDYAHRKFEGEFELISLLGNISLKEGKHFAHTHITFSDTMYRVYGGHLFDAKITAAGEFVMIPGKKNINRKLSPEIGIHLWCLET